VDFPRRQVFPRGCLGYNRFYTRLVGDSDKFEQRGASSQDGKAVGGVMHKVVSRREFLRYAGVAGAAIASGGLGWLVAACGGSSTTTTRATTATTVSASNETTGSPTTQTTGATSPETTKSQSSTDSGGRVAYLTFDDGPSKLTRQLLDVLAAQHVTATFFVIGTRAKKYPGMLKEIASAGHAIGVHSWTHDYAYIYKNTDNFLSDFDKLKDYIHQETGIAPQVCRFPGGTSNTLCLHYNKNHIMKQIINLVHKMGFEYFDWNVSSAEAASPPPTKEQIIKSVPAQCKKKNMAVILFHDAAIQGYVDALPEVISQLRSMGFKFETLSTRNPPKSKLRAVQYKPAPD
jgi:peptidoglycan-N-acetylglucosamine deacetylase